MKKAHIQLFKTYSSIIAVILAIIAFTTSCTTESEYGRPSAKFIVKGQVLSDENKLPLKDIKVLLLKNTGLIMKDSIFVKDSAITDVDGNYEVSENIDYPVNNLPYLISFIDVDKDVNGLNQPLDTAIVFTNPRFIKGDGHWYVGETSQVLDVKLNPKKE